MAKEIQPIIEKLVQSFPGQVEAGETAGQVMVAASALLPVMEKAKGELGFNMLADLTAVDYPENFEMVYHLMAIPDATMLKVKVKLDKGSPRVASLVGLWPAADVQERETYDLMGIFFEGHPNLKRILCPEDFQGHPLRKDYILKTRS